MIKSILKISLLSLIAAAIAGTPTQVFSQQTNKHEHAEKPEPKANKSGTIPFHGKLKAVDKTAKTISVGETTVQITSETKIMKAEKPATLEDGVIGEPVSGAYKKSADGKLNATTLRFGAKPEAAEGEAKPEKKPKKEKTAQ